MSKFVFVYSTFPDQNSALRVAEHLVDTKLAACANLSAPITSVYQWEGKRETGIEIAALFKTRAALADRLIEAARPLHPYEVPCFVVLPIETGSSDYLNWVRAQTLGDGS
jgi:periplasmic divalent cation tolerance protein